MSYRHAEGGSWVARNVAAELSKYLGPDAVFYDTSSIPGALEWSEVIHQSILQSSACLVLIHPGWIQKEIFNPDDWVHREISLALQRALFVVPVVVDGARMPLPKELPDNLKPLLALQAAFIEGRSDASLVATTDILAKLLMSRLQAQVVLKQQRPGVIGLDGTCKYILRFDGEPLVTLDGSASTAMRSAPSGVHALSIAWIEDEERPIYVERRQGPGYFSKGETIEKSFALRPGIHTFTLGLLPDKRSTWLKVRDAILLEPDKLPREIVEESFESK